MIAVFEELLVIIDIWYKISVVQDSFLFHLLYLVHPVSFTTSLNYGVEVNLQKLDHD